MNDVRRVAAPLHNWAGNVTFSTPRVARPRSLDELRELVVTAGRVRALGTAHSFSTVADTDGVLVSLAAMPTATEVDETARTATVSGWLRWGELAPAVDAHGLALHNMGSLPHISVAGSVATGTHGSGSRLGCLAAAVRAVELVTADGDLRMLRRGDADFDGAVVALGCLGIVTRVEMDLVPAFEIAQTVWDDLPFGVAVERFDEVLDSARSVSLFTTTWSGESFEQVWVKRDTSEPDADLGWTGARRATGPRHPIPRMDTAACTEQGGQPGPWYARMPHFRLEFTPSSGHELQTEYLLPRRHAGAALEAVRPLGARIAPVLQTSEIRTVAADDLWLSPCQGRDTVAVHFTWVPDLDRVAPVVEAVEAALAPYDARPHWGKVFSTSPDRVRGLYPKLDRFADLRRRLDPSGRFANDFTDRYLAR